MRPDAMPGVLRLLHDVHRRRTALDACAAVAAGAVIAAVTFALLRWSGVSAIAGAAAAVVLALAAGAVMWVRGGRGRSQAAAAKAIERARPECRNLVITAEEIVRHPERVSSWMGEWVVAEASRATTDVRPSEVIPAGRTLGLCAGAMLAAALVLVLPGSKAASGVLATIARQVGRATPGGFQVMVTVAPPAYTGGKPQALKDPERIDALEGSRLTFTASGEESRAVRFGARTLGQVSAAASVEMIARDSGYFALESGDNRRQLIALSVTRDRLPRVRIEQPAKDLLLPDATRTIPLSVAASDDLGLEMLELRYTKVSGTGEQFEFEEGALPLRVERASGREWRGEARLALPGLALEPGDSLVYRAVARDSRPGSTGLASSDTYFVEIAGPGQVALEGVEMPPEEERYALSQQMIVLRIERLRAREAALARQKVVEESADIAAEQRAVRANFVFLLGGHVEDEEVEAEQSSEISEGRLQNTARRDVNAAIREMTRAEQGLVAASTTAALPPARAAVAALQRAFGKSRYLLRAMPGTGRIDPSRRLAGQLAAASTWRRDLFDPPPRDGDAARALLADLLALDTRAADLRRMERLAEQALAVDPASATWQAVSRRLLAMRDGARAPARAELNQLIATVEAESARGLLPRTALASPSSRLQRAWEGRQR